MNTAFQSYTPRTKPLNYDALLSQEGCEAESGNTFFDVLPFETVCIFGHDPENWRFNQSDLVSYFDGPATNGVSTKPFLARWGAWVGNTGVQVGKLSSVVPPASNLGELSALYPNFKPKKVSGAFSDKGLLALAVQKTPDSVEIKRYTDTSGTIATKSFSGYSAILFNIGLILHRDPESPGLVCYYLLQERPGVMFTRFEVESFDVEHILMPDLRTPLARLISTYSVGNRQFLVAIDQTGRDVTIKTRPYSNIVRDKGKIAISLQGGAVYNLGVKIALPAEKGTLAISLLSGYVFASIAEPANQPPAEAGNIGIALLGGEVI